MRAGPPRLQPWAELLGALVLLGAVLPSAALTRLLLVPAAVLLLALGVRDLLLNPVLEADATGVRVVSGTRRLSLNWEQVDGARVVTDRRAPLLELDLGDTLVVLSRNRLGMPPYRALEELEAVRPAT